MNNRIVRNIVCAVLFVVCVLLVFLIYRSVMKPVNFNKEMALRSNVAIQRLKDIRTLEVAFKGEHGRYTASIDTLKDFYTNGKMKIIMQIGSEDDSLAVAHTGALKKKNPRITGADMYKLYLAGDKNLVFAVESTIDVCDTLFNNRPDFCLDSLGFVPFSGGAPTEIESDDRMVSGVNVPLFEARMPYQALLKGMDRQLIINLKAEKNDQGKYPGLQVGSITAPNNNAGNWE